MFLLRTPSNWGYGVSTDHNFYPEKASNGGATLYSIELLATGVHENSQRTHTVGKVKGSSLQTNSKGPIVDNNTIQPIEHRKFQLLTT